MKKKIAVLSGDGIGPEVTAQSIKVLDTIAELFGHKFTYEEGLVGAIAIDETGDPFPEKTLKLCNKSDAVLFGAIGHPKYDNDPKAKVRPEQGLLKMRKQLGLFTNIRPVKAYDLLKDASPLKAHVIQDVDFVVFRELTSGIYFGEPRGRSEDGNTAFDTCIYTKDEIIRITKLAFEAAKRRSNHVTLVDKANVLASSRLWREVVVQYAKEHYSDVHLDFLFVDNAAMQLILNPRHFDVILTGNLFGDIISDEGSVITGSIGMLPSASVGNKIALFEPIHGSYPEGAGKDIANPMASILSAAMMLETSFGLVEEARLIERCVETCLETGFVTEDLAKGGKAQKCSAVGDKVAELVRAAKV